MFYSKPVKNHETNSSILSNLREVFEGLPLFLPSHEIYGPVLLFWALGAAATLILRVRFDREWNLTLWTAHRINRVWQRLSDESASTGGAATSHVMGVVSWAIFGGVWAVAQESHLPNESAQVWTGCAGGAALGFITLIARSIGAWIGGWITLKEIAVQRGLETDRHMRNWLLWLLMAAFLIFLVQNPRFEGQLQPLDGMATLWWIWIGLKWLRQLQTVIRSSVHFGWGIAYICTFEIGPTWILYLEFMEP